MTIFIILLIVGAVVLPLGCAISIFVEEGVIAGVLIATLGFILLIVGWTGNDTEKNETVVETYTIDTYESIDVINKEVYYYELADGNILHVLKYDEKSSNFNSDDGIQVTITGYGKVVIE